MKISIKKKIIVPIMFLFFVFNTNKAEAIFCANCYNVVQGFIDFVEQTVTSASTALTGVETTISAGANMSLKMKELALDKVAFVISNEAIGSLKGEMSNWINTGYEGKPLFLESPDKLFANISEDQLLLVKSKLLGDAGLLAQNKEITKFLIEGINDENKFTESITPTIGNAICSKLGKDISDLESQISISKNDIKSELENVLAGTKSEYNDSCVNGGEGEKYKAQQNCAKDFSCGGMDAILAITRNQGVNTEEGRYNNALAEFVKEKEKKTKVIEQELDRGSGFLNQKECIKTEKIEGREICQEYKTINPGTAAASALNKLVTSPIDENLRVDELGELVSAASNSFLSSFSLGGIKKAIVDIKNINSAINKITGTVNNLTGNNSGGVTAVTNSSGVTTYQYVTQPPNATATIPVADPKYDLDPDGYKSYMQGNLEIINLAISGNSKARDYVVKEMSIYQNVFNSYQIVVNCYKNGSITKNNYPSSVPTNIRQRGESLYAKIQVLQKIIDDSLSLEKNVNSKISLMVATKNLLTLDFYKEQILKDLESSKSLKIVEWKIRDYENSNSSDGDNANSLYSKLTKEAEETSRNASSVGGGESSFVTDNSPIGMCIAANTNVNGGSNGI